MKSAKNRKDRKTNHLQHHTNHNALLNYQQAGLKKTTEECFRYV
jgi:hypothetical protein